MRLWPRGSSTLFIEFVALSNHRKVIRAEIANYAEQLRNLPAAALSLMAARVTLRTS